MTHNSTSNVSIYIHKAPIAKISKIKNDWREKQETVFKSNVFPV